MLKLKRKIGWMLMGIPWWSNRTVTRGMARNNWHCKLYMLGSRLASY